MTKTVAIIQARLGSSRLPAKVLLPLPTGRSVIEEVVRRARQIVGVQNVVLAVPSEDDTLLDFIDASMSVDVVLGPKDDVLSRFHLAAEAFPADAYMRITADCPLLNPVVCSELLRRFWEGKYEYASNSWPARSYPHGWDCEVFSHEMLELATHRALTVHDREHVTPWMQRQSRDEYTGFLLKSLEDRSHVRVTLDTIEDYRAICAELRDQIAAGLYEV